MRFGLLNDDFELGDSLGDCDTWRVIRWVRKWTKWDPLDRVLVLKSPLEDGRGNIFKIKYHKLSFCKIP